MSDNIPLELQVEIFKRVPVKSLLRFRSVSKQWKSLIDSHKFADDYCLRQPQPHRLLIRYADIEQVEQLTSSLLDSRHSGCKYNYVSFADDADTFHQYQFPLPESVNSLIGSQIVGCSHGLVCFYGHKDNYVSIADMAVLWNPLIRKSVDVPIPNVLRMPYQTILGFGVSPQTKVPKIVKINNNFTNPRADPSVPIPWRVEVFTLSSRTWKTPSGSRNNLPSRNSIIFPWSQVAVDGVIYWHALEIINVDGRPCFHNLIMSFDLSSEGFEEVCLPDHLARLYIHQLHISKRMESVVVLEMDETGTYCVWMMEQGVTKSFTKLFTVMTRGSSPVCRLRGFMKNGESIVDRGSNALFACDPYSERIKDLGIFGKSESFSVESYMETLLLIDQ